MAFTGRLGSADSRLGNLVLAFSGSGAKQLQLRARIRGVEQTLQLRAHITPRVEQSLQLRARINNTLYPFSLRARIRPALQLRAYVRGIASADLPVTFDAQVRIQQDLTVTFDATVGTPAFRSLRSRALIRAAVTTDLPVTFDADYVMPTTCVVQPTTQVLAGDPTVPGTDVTALVPEWSVSDDFGNLSRQFDLQFTSGSTDLQVGRGVRLRAGYAGTNVTLLTGVLDEVSRQDSVAGQRWSATGRDRGAFAATTIRVTKTFESQPPHATPSAHGVLAAVAGAVGLTLGALAFPNYALYATFAVVGRTLAEVVGQLLEPFNQFASRQYVPVVRDNVLEVRFVDWATSSGPVGYTLSLGEHSTHERRQVLFLDPPNLTAVSSIFVRGATYTVPVGEAVPSIQTRVEYSRSTAMAEVTSTLRDGNTAAGGDFSGGAGPIGAGDDSTNGSPSNPTPGGDETVTEVSSVEHFYGDKVLERIETTYVNGRLVGKVLEANYYYDPTNSAAPGQVQVDLATIADATAAPSPTALLYATHTIRYGIVSRRIAGVTTETFDQLSRAVSQTFYNARREVTSEITTAQDFDTDTFVWNPATHVVRTHSQVTGGAVRTHKSDYAVNASSRLVELTAGDTQVVGGSRPRLNEPSSRASVAVVQFQSPPVTFDGNGAPQDPGEGLFSWSYSNPYIGDALCAVVRGLAEDERTRQVAGYRWERISFEGIFNPNLRVGQRVRIEVTTGVFVDYWLEQVTHTVTTSGSFTRGAARRLTLDALT